MKIHDLTRGKFSQMYQYLTGYEYETNPFFAFQRLFSNRVDIEQRLDQIPVFLVESSMANEYIAVPGCQCSVQVPEDRYVSCTGDEFDIDEWIASKEDGKDDPRRREPKSFNVVDLFGVYIYDNRNQLMPRKIFVWMDKIYDYAQNSNNKRAKTSSNCARALFELVLYHEMSHAAMDVELYDMYPAPKFSYSDYIYRFIEEAYANALALNAVYEQFSSDEQIFIESFVKSQAAGYSHGWDFYKHPVANGIEQWMCMKVLFNYDVAFVLKECWEHRNFEIPSFVKNVDHDGWIAVQDRFKTWALIDCHTHQPINGFKKYHSFWSFDKNGLCLVRLDQEPKRSLWGYINEQGEEQIPVVYDYIYNFEDGITIAKKDGRYGAIDMNNNTVIAFNLPYQDVREFRDGQALVKDCNGNWGKIDRNGNEVVPCK